MLATNPIWFREQQAWRARSKRLPVWRRSRYLTLPCIWLGCAGMAVLLQLLSRGSFSLQNVVEPTIAVAFFVQIGSLVFRSLIAGSAVLVRERELQTMDSLLSSPLPARDLLVGKWLVAAIPLAIETTMVVPIAAVLLTFAEPSRWDPIRGYWQIGDLYLLSLALIVFLTGVGLRLSAQSTRSSRSASQAVLIGLMLLLGTYVLDLLLQLFTRWNVPILCLLNPYAAVSCILEPESGLVSTLWGWTAIGYLVLAVLVGLGTWKRLRRAANV